MGENAKTKIEFSKENNSKYIRVNDKENNSSYNLLNKNLEGFECSHKSFEGFYTIRSFEYAQTNRYIIKFYNCDFYDNENFFHMGTGEFTGIEFENCRFHNPFNPVETTIHVNISIIFKESSFFKKISFENINFGYENNSSGRILFEGCHFYDEVTFGKSQFYFNITFKNSFLHNKKDETEKNRMQFQKLDLQKSLIFENVKCEENTEIEFINFYEKPVTFSNMMMSNITFNHSDIASFKFIDVIWPLKKSKKLQLKLPYYQIQDEKYLENFSKQKSNGESSYPSELGRKIESVERHYRTLKNKYLAINDKHKADLFHSSELKIKCLRNKYIRTAKDQNPKIKNELETLEKQKPKAVWETIYRKISHFGMGILRPICMCILYFGKLFRNYFWGSLVFEKTNSCYL